VKPSFLQDICHINLPQNIFNMKSYHFSIAALFILLVLPGFNLGAQSIDRQVFGSGGGAILADDGVQMDYHMGEAVASTVLGTNTRLNQGFIQSDAIITTSLREIVTREYSWYPNPTSDELFIQCASCDIRQWSIYNAQGQLMQTSGSETHWGAQLGINVSHLSPGLYLISILDGHTDNSFGTHLKFIKI